AALVSPAYAAPLPPGDVALVDSGQGVAQPEILLASLVQEITAEAPPGGSSSIDIQFNSRTLEGLHVRVQKAGESVEVRFPTSSDAVSQLLNANADSLREALIQRGYVAPAVSVQQTQGPAAFPSGGSRRPGRDRGGRGGHDQRGGQKRR